MVTLFGCVLHISYVPHGHNIIRGRQNVPTNNNRMGDITDMIFIWKSASKDDFCYSQIQQKH